MSKGGLVGFALLVAAISLMLSTTVAAPSANPKPVANVYKNKILNEVNLMRSRWQVLDAECSPNAIFALTYLYMTDALYNTVSSGYFDDGELMANFTIDFASRYSLAIDNFMNNNPTAIPAPWKQAFDYGASGYSSVQENLVLGMNAHINFDLSAVVFSMNYGTSGNKADYDRINDILTTMAPNVTFDLGTRYDATLLSPAYAALNPAILALLFSWRENAWTNAVLQMNSLPVLRPTLQASVLAEALSVGLTQMSYNLGTPTTASREAYCIANHGPSRL